MEYIEKLKYPISADVGSATKKSTTPGIFKPGNEIQTSEILGDREFSTSFLSALPTPIILHQDQAGQEHF